VQRADRTYLFGLLVVVGWVEARGLLAVVRDRPLAFAEFLGGGLVCVGGRHGEGCLVVMNSPDGVVYSGRGQGKTCVSC